MMRVVPCVFAVLAFSTAAFSQAPEPTPTPVKLVVTDTMPKVRPRIAAAPTPTPVSSPVASPTPIIVGSSGKMSGPSESAKQSEPIVVGQSPNKVQSGGANAQILSFGQIKSKIAEAKRHMLTRPIATALTDGTVPNEFVRVAFHDWNTQKIDYVVMSKESFLSTAGDKQTISEGGRRLIARTIRGNGVNTPIVLIDERGENHLPLLVQYPVVRGGKYMETAYYMSTHPGLVTSEVVSAGKYYVRNMIEIAREKLREKGILIQPKVADIAERLATVEHVDHQRFRTEYHPNIYNDVFTLFALNEGQTYRYSVSSAGAGGMVQMIPSTYRMVRSWHPNVPLMPDFVEGMRNHVNASQAMLLYMQRTWNDLISNSTVSYALSSGIATQEQLMAAGYNSNPARLAGYINRGGENWTSLIPRETKVYLQIYSSLEKHVPMTARTK